MVRSRSMNVSATGLDVRCFNVTISIGCDCIGSLTGKPLTGQSLRAEMQHRAGQHRQKRAGHDQPNANGQGIGDDQWLAYVSEFVEDAKASGLVQKAIDRVGPRGSAVAAPGDSNE
jgi:hypothetical protein